MNIIPALEMKGWRPFETNCTDSQVVVKCELYAKADFFCRLCSCKMHRRGTRQISITDTPYMQYDVKLLIDTPYFYCPHCNKYAVVRLEPVHPRIGKTLLLMGHISRLMREVSAKLLSGVLRLSESSILRVDKDILTPRAATITLQASPAVLIFLGGVKIE